MNIFSERIFLLTMKAAASLLILLFLFPGVSPAQDASRSPGWVVIPVEEYQSLRAGAYPNAVEPPGPPVDATLTRVDYDLRVNGELATGRASLTVDVLRDGWVRVAIPSGLLVREARLDGKLVSLVPPAQGEGGSQLSAVLSHPGRALLLLDIALPVSSGAGEESIVLPSTASGVTRATVQLPQQGVDVKLTGGLLVEKSQPAAFSPTGQSKWLAYGRGNEPLTFSWHRKMEDHRLEQLLRMRGSLVQLLGLGEDMTTIYAEVNLEIIQGAAREVKIQLPENVNINQVSGAVVADWEMKPGELKVTFLEPVEQTARFVINGETRTARDGQIQVPLLRLLNNERESGGVAVEVTGAGEIKDVKAQGLESADASDLGNMIANRQSPSLVAFRIRSGDSKTNRLLTINVARYTQQAVLVANVEEARYQVLMSSEGKVLVQARYAIRNNQRNFLKVTLPQGATIWSATLAGKPVRPGESPDGSVLLPLEKARAGEDAPVFAVEVFYLSRQLPWSDKGQARLDLPALDLPISRTGLVFYHPLFFKVTTTPGAFRVQRFEPPISPALNPAIAAGTSDGQRAQPTTPQRAAGAGDTNPEVDQFRESFWSSSGTHSARVLPIRVSFPAFGPSLFLVSELTAENRAQAIEFSYQHEKKESAQ